MMSAEEMEETEKSSTSNVTQTWSLSSLADNEFLNRIIYDSEWFDGDGQLTPSAISISDLKSSGFSLNRDFVAAAVIRRLIDDAIKKLPEKRETPLVSRFVAGAVPTIVGVVPNRKLKKDEVQQPEQLFVAFPSPQKEDTSKTPPFPANDAHAHILCLHAGESTLKALRSKLIPLLSNIISVDQFIEIIEKEAAPTSTADKSA